MKKLKWCANGCGVPPESPSLVICKKCQEKITKTLKDLVEGFDRQPKPTESRGV